MAPASPPGAATRHRRWPELLLVAAVALVVALLLIPLPPLALDLLLAANLAAAVLILMVALAVREPTSVTVFPALLLITTLLRLGLNVSSTRLILSRGYAGQVIDAFASWVVGASLVVGVVVFLILTVIQFVVIARGSERVAEVAARFALDAMPGRQMAIDADLRAGALTPQQAQDARAALQRESSLYGAMDGAMKFVKGDAIAGLIILSVDLIGGVLVGAVERDMSLGGALRHYGLLTIGDGLVSQIPALLVATSAGLVVTRVAGAASTSHSGHLGAEMARQLGRYPWALGATAGLLTLLALAPGLPALPFAALALGCGAGAWQAQRVHQARAADPHDPSRALDDALPPPIELLWPGPLDADQRALAAALDPELAALSRRSGVALPPLTWRAGPPGLLILRLDGVDSLHLTPESASAPALRAALEARLPTLLTMQRVHQMLERWRVREPMLVSALVPAHLSLHRLTLTLRRLLEDGVGLEPLRPVLEALLGCPADARLDALHAAARLGAAARLRALLDAEQRPLLRVGPNICRVLEEAHVAPERELDPPGLRLPPAAVRELLDALEAAADADELPLNICALITTHPARVPLHTILAAHHPGARVLSLDELAVAAVDDLDAIPVADVGHILR